MVNTPNNKRMSDYRELDNEELLAQYEDAVYWYQEGACGDEQEEKYLRIREEVLRRMSNHV
jgi:hypothetical protein